MLKELKTSGNEGIVFTAHLELIVTGRMGTISDSKGICRLGQIVNVIFRIMIFPKE